MTELYKYLNSILPLADETWIRVEELFKEKTILKSDYFINEGEQANQIGFLQSGIIRALYRNNEGVEYNKHFLGSQQLLFSKQSLALSNYKSPNYKILSNVFNEPKIRAEDLGREDVGFNNDK